MPEVDCCGECRHWKVQGLKWYGRCDCAQSKRYGTLTYKLNGCDQGAPIKAKGK